ncbi:MAG TPA: ribose 5-phosphate isomerase B, partial [Terriglobales bacterium]
MRIALGADHAGFELKETIKRHLIDKGITIDDQGTHSPDSVDYPDYARLVCEQLAQKKADWGILVCGTGIGMAMAANKMPGIRAANARSEIDAQLSREHNNANVLTLGGRVLDEKTAVRIVDRWLNTAFLGGRHERRVAKITELERP